MPKKQTGADQRRSRDTINETNHLVQNSESAQRPSHPTTQLESFNASPFALADLQVE
jgi:hypothetical protein